MNTIIKFDLIDGTQIDMTLTYGKLLKARAKYPEEYETFNKIDMNGAKDVFDFVDVVYMGYLCANMESEHIMSKDEFMDRITPNRKDIMKAYSELLYPKKKPLLEGHFKNGQEAQKKT